MNWTDLRDPNDPRLDQLAAEHHLHPLHIEDCRHRHQLAKVEDGPGYLFVVLKTLEQKDHAGVIVRDIDLFIGRDFAITVIEPHNTTMAQMLDKLKTVHDISRTDQLLYRVMDNVVDSYLPAIEKYTEEIDEIEDAVLQNPAPEMLQRIFALKRVLMSLRRVSANMRDVAAHLQRTPGELIPQDMWPFWRDVYDHLARDLDMVEAQRDLLTGAMDIYLSSVANRTNQVMKVLTVLSTVALPSIVVSGIYGMNIKGIPWLTSPHGMEIVGALMGGTTVALLLMLRIMRWL